MTSQLPWKVEIFGDRLDKHIRILDANDSVICILPPRQMSNGYPPQELREKSAFIVRACNNHERLVEALKSIADHEWVNKIDDVKQLQKWINEFVYVAKQALQSAERLG